MLKRQDIRIRDPYILTDKEEGCYYMYGTTSLCSNSLRANSSFSVFKSYDLENFTEPKVIFDGEKCGFWADRDYWAAEVHKFNDKYYLFGSVKAEGRCRATEIFVCDTPDGDFVHISKDPVTPIDWECLDGTLYVENGVPYMIFCHEWVQVGDGEMCAVQLSEDLSHAVGEPILLFKASSEPTVEDVYRKGTANFVTDGPYIYREGDKLRMIWSSLTTGARYAVLMAESDSLLGKWDQLGSHFDFDGGHAMVFYTLEGKRMISLHAPNSADDERAVFYEF